MELVFNAIQDVHLVLEILISALLVSLTLIEFKPTEHALVLLDIMMLDKLIVLYVLSLA